MRDLQSDAIIWNGRIFSWGLVEAYVHSTSRRLKEIGVKSGARVLVEAVPSAGMVIVLLSLWHMGAIACPFDPRLSVPMARDIQSSINPFLLLGQAVPDERFKGLRSCTIDDVICVEPVEHFISGSLDSLPLSGKGDATIILTTGSSGTPRAVLHDLQAHYANAEGAAQVIPFGKGDRWLMSLPLHHVSGISVIFRALYGNGTMVFPWINSNDIHHAIKKFRPTHISLVPTQFLRLAEALSKQDWGSFKAILIGGAPVPERLMDKAVELQLPVFLTYGMTETASQMATGPLRDVRQHGALVLARREASVIDGEICVRGDVLFKGYVQGRDIIRPFDAHGWFHTGDMGEIRKNHVIVNGRKDRMFVSGGENIFPEIIERALLCCSDIINARVEPEQNEEFGKVAVAFVSLKQGLILDEQKLKGQLRKTLLPFQVPKRIVISDGALPLGKHPTFKS